MDNQLSANHAATHDIVELTSTEIESVHGGLGPALALGAAAIGHFTARGIISGLAARFGLGYAVFDAARAYGGGSSRRLKDHR